MKVNGGRLLRREPPRPTFRSWTPMRQRLFPGLLPCPVSRRDLDPRTTRVRPAKWLGEDAVEIRDEAQQLRAQILHRGERAAPDHLPHDHPEDRLDLVQPRA